MAGLFLSGLFIWPQASSATLTLPQTSCDARLNGVNLISSAEVLEDGTKAFSYGSNNQTFTAKTGTVVSLNINLLFAKVPNTSIRVLFIDNNCASVAGYGFQPDLVSGMNIFTYDSGTDNISINGIDLGAIRANGLPRYLRVEVLDDYRFPVAASYSYLVDLTNPQNPSGNEPPPEPTGKRPVLIIPGIMGTEIKKGEEYLWPDVARMLLTNNDRFMDALSYDSDNYPLDDSLIMGKIISRLPKFNYSESLVSEFISLGYQENVNLFTFPYDWRKDLDEIAQNELKDKIDKILSDTGFKKIDIIAHSQGGLVIKRLLFDQETYTEKIDKLVFVGTPNLGSPQAAKVLLYGDSMSVSFLGLGLDPSEVQRISQNLPSVYELLPSKEYLSHGQAYLGIAKTLSFLITGYSTLNYDDSEQYLKDSGLNSGLVDRANVFHSENFDNYDFTGSGINAFNIIGCQSPTVVQVLAGKNGRFWLNYGPGDGTVPLISASNIWGTKNYYSKNADHGSMMTQDGSRQLIENIISGSNQNLQNQITQDQSQCRYDGQQVSVHSPVELHIYDEYGNHVGPNATGSTDVEIPGVQYDVLGTDKFAFLPKDKDYVIKLIATDSGQFDFYSSKIENNVITSTAFYSGVPITGFSKAEITLNVNNNQAIKLDINGDNSFDQNILPSAILDNEEMQDLINPTTAGFLSGDIGEPGFYRSDVTLALSANDPVILGKESQTSGILKTLYSLDNNAFNEYTTPLVASSEGEHKVIFYSIDKAGNREDQQSLDFTIDKTPPEFLVSYDLTAKSFIFSSTDNIDKNFQITCTMNKMCTSVDVAGNETMVNFEIEKHDDKKLNLKSINYSGKSIIKFPKNEFKVEFDSENKSNLVKEFKQSIKIKDEEKISSEYQSKKGQSVIVIKEKKERLKQVIPGMKFLLMSTKQGNINVGIK